MKLKWIDKNIEKEIEILVDNPIDSNYSEDLDSATVLLENQEEQLNIEILDEVRLGNTYLCISDYEERMVNPKEPHYDYTITLVSQVKETEGIILPNLSITKTEKNRSVWFYINEYMRLYAPKIRVGNEQSWSWQSKWSISANVLNKFYSIVCPEMQWNRPTLREVLTDLMMVADCIPVLRNKELDLMDLSERKAAIDESKILSVNKSKSLSDYTTEIEMELQNVIQNEEDDVYNLTNIVEYTGFRNENEYALSTDNANIYTKNPIYKIKHLWMCFTLNTFTTNVGDEQHFDYIEIDLCNIKEGNKTFNFVKEYKEYITLPIAYDTITSGIDTFEEMIQYQNFNLYFNRGGNQINGFFDETKQFWFVNVSFIELLIKRIGEVYFNYTNVNIQHILNNEYLKGVSFKIEYQCLANTKFRAGKYLPQENERVIIDNQTNAFVNAERQGLLEYMKANRLGNEMLIINARYDNLNEVEEVGTTYKDDYVVFKSQTQVNPNYVNTVYYATKNFVLRNYFTGVKSKIRSWKIENEESLVRNELVKYYYEFSFDDKEIDDGLPISERIMLTPFITHYDDEIFKYAFIRTMIGYNGNNEIWYPRDYTNNNYWYIGSELNNKILGNSIVLSTKLLDNYSNGVYIDNEEVIKTVTYPIEKDARYVNNIGEFEQIYLRMCGEDSLNLSDSSSWSFPELIINGYFKTTPIDYTGTSTDTYHRLLNLFKNKPLATTSIFKTDERNIYSQLFDIHKDQREVISLNLQLEYCSDTEDIVFGSQLVKDNNISSTNYRTLYESSEIVSVGELTYFQIYGNINQAPVAYESNKNKYVIANYKYYKDVLKNADYSLYDRRIDRTETQVQSMGGTLTGYYVIGKTVSYSYPDGCSSSDRNLAFTEIYEGTVELSEQENAGSYVGKYAVGWTYNNVRLLDTFNIVKDYQNSSVGDNVGIATTNDRYKIVNHLKNSIYYLYDLDITRTEAQVQSLGNRLNGKYVIGLVNDYAYPTGCSASDRNLGFTDVYEGTNGIENSKHAADYSNKYAVGWTYDDVRILDTTNIQTKYQIVQSGVSIEPAGINNRYKVVSHLVNPSYNNGNARLTSKDVVTDVSSLTSYSSTSGYYIVCKDINPPSEYYWISSEYVQRTSNQSNWPNGTAVYDVIVAKEDSSDKYPHIGSNYSDYGVKITPIISGTANPNYIEYQLWINNSLIGNFSYNQSCIIEHYRLVDLFEGYSSNNFIRVINNGGVGGPITVKFRIEVYNTNTQQVVSSDYYQVTESSSVSVNPNNSITINNSAYPQIITQICKPASGKDYVYQWNGSSWVRPTNEPTPNESPWSSAYYRLRNTNSYYSWNGSSFAAYTQKTNFLFQCSGGNSWTNTGVKMTDIAGNTNTFRYSNTNVYWTGFMWAENNVFQYQLWKSQYNYWYLNQDNYISDNVNIYKTNAGTTYYKWDNGWAEYTENKKYYWYLSTQSQGTWRWENTGVEVADWAYSWIGTNVNSANTVWYNWSPTTKAWVDYGVTTVTTIYYLYTYTGGQTVRQDVTFQRTTTFRYESNGEINNYIWELEQYALDTNKGDWSLNNEFSYQLWHSSNGNWYVDTDNYASDSTNVYKSSSSSTYYKWNNGWEEYEGNDKIYYWYVSVQSQGSFIWENTVVLVETNATAWIGNVVDSPNTTWWRWTQSNNWFQEGVTIETAYYHLYTYESGSVVQKDSTFLREHTFASEGDNYIWGVTNLATDEGDWEKSNVYEWQEIGSASNLYFYYSGNTYQYNATTNQLVYQSLTPIRDVIRTDSRLDSNFKLKLYTSDDKVRLYDMDYLPMSKTEIVGWSLNINSNELIINFNTTITNKTVYITDSNNNVLLAFNLKGSKSSQSIYLNGYRSRNKKIYN